MAFFFWGGGGGVRKQNLIGRLIFSSYLSPIPSFPIIVTPISIDVYNSHTPSTIAANPRVQVLLTIFLFTGLLNPVGVCVSFLRFFSVS